MRVSSLVRPPALSLNYGSAQALLGLARKLARMSLTAEDVVRLFEEDERARRRLAELLISEPDVRLAIINAVLRDVATKSDLERLAASLRGDMKSLEASLREEVRALGARVSGLEARMSGLEQRVARLEGQLSLFVKLFVAFNLPILLGVVGILLKMALAP